MNNKIIITSLLLVGMILTGFIVSRSGKPYGTLLLTLHKLVSLGALIFLVVTVNQAIRITTVNPITLVVIILSAVLFIALFATGGIVSAMKAPPRIILTIHYILPYMLAVSTLGTLFLFRV